MTPHPGQRVSVPVPLTREDSFGRLCAIGAVRRPGIVLDRHSGVCTNLETTGNRPPEFAGRAKRPTVDQLGNVLVRVEGARGAVVLAHFTELDAVH